MEEFNINPIEKEFLIHGYKIKKKVVLNNFTAYNHNGKETIERTKGFPQNCTTLYDYDELGNLIHLKNSFGTEYWYEYDSSGNKSYLKTSEGDEVFFEYDNNDNCIYSKSSRGFEMQYKYNELNLKYFEFNSRFGHITLYQYDRNNRLIRSIDSDGCVTRYYYDSKGNLTYNISSIGFLEYFEYDSQGNKIYSADCELFDEKIDVENFILDINKYEKRELYFEYEFYPNGKIQKMYIYENSEE